MDLEYPQATRDLESDMVVDPMDLMGDEFDDAVAAKVAALDPNSAPGSGAETAVPAATTVAATVQPASVLTPTEVPGQGSVLRLKGGTSDFASAELGSDTALPAGFVLPREQSVVPAYFSSSADSDAASTRQ